MSNTPNAQMVRFHFDALVYNEPQPLKDRNGNIVLSKSGNQVLVKAQLQGVQRSPRITTTNGVQTIQWDRRLTVVGEDGSIHQVLVGSENILAPRQQMQVVSAPATAQAQA